MPDMPWHKAMNMVLNRRGEWVPAIPLPVGGLRKLCPEKECGTYWWTMDGYRGHYALAHIMRLD